MIYTIFANNSTPNENVSGLDPMSNWKDEITALKQQLSDGTIDVHQFYKSKEEILSRASSESTFYMEVEKEDRTQGLPEGDENEDDFHLQNVDNIFMTEIEHPRELGQYKIIETYVCLIHI